MLSKILPALRSLSPAHRSVLAGGAAAVVALSWACWPTLCVLASRWHSDPQYSHGYLVPLFAIALLWLRREQVAWDTFRPAWWGLLLLAGGLGLHFAGTFFYFDWLAGFALLPCVAGLFVLAGGRAGLRWCWPAVAFLLFMVPLPHQAEVALAQPLQRIATKTSTYALQTLGFAAFAEGNVIRMGQVRIGVVEACSGLSMMVIFFALATAVVLLVRRPWYEKTVILVSAIPIAVIANVIRITVTGVLHKTAGRELADIVFHDLAGWLMMPLALGLLWVELRLLRWVLISRSAEVTTTVPVARRRAAPAVSGAPRQPGQTDLEKAGQTLASQAQTSPQT